MVNSGNINPRLSKKTMTQLFFCQKIGTYQDVLVLREREEPLEQAMSTQEVLVMCNNYVIIILTVGTDIGCTTGLGTSWGMRTGG